MRGIGWTVFYQDSEAGKLIYFWINEHDEGHPAVGIPILVMDVFENDYVLDYGLNEQIISWNFQEYCLEICRELYEIIMIE